METAGRCRWLSFKPDVKAEKQVRYEQNVEEFF
jgi:hypothetical protein